MRRPHHGLGGCPPTPGRSVSRERLTAPAGERDAELPGDLRLVGQTAGAVPARDLDRHGEPQLLRGGQRASPVDPRGANLRTQIWIRITFCENSAELEQVREL